MAQEIIGAKVQVDTGDVKSFKTQLREANNELLKMSANFGESSKEAVKAAQKVAQLKDAIGDAKNLVEQFNPDAKFKTLTTVIGGVASGFTALQGAIGLFGTESEDVTKSLQKVQSAMAFSQGINQLGELRDGLKNAATVIKTQLVTAFSTLKGAIIATGVGALVVSLGLIVANFDAVKEAVLKAIPGLETFGKWVTKAYNATTDWLGVTSAQTRALDALEEATKASSSAIEGQIKILTAQGGKEAEIYELRKKLIEDNRKLLVEKAGSIDKLNGKELESYLELNNQLAVLDASETKRKQDVAKDREKKLQAIKEEEFVNEQIALKERLDKEYQLELDAYNQRKKLKEGNIESTDYTKLKEQKKKDEEEEKRRQEDQQKLNEEFNNTAIAKRLTANAAANEQIRKSNEATANANIELAKKEAEAKAEALNATATALTNLSLIAGKETVAGKALAIAASLINTYQGITKSLAAGGFLGIAQAIAVGAAGFAAVKQIVSVEVPGGGGTASPNTPNVGSIAPLTPQLIAPTTTQLDQRSINALGNRAIRAYVVESEITSGQERISRIQTATRFG